MREKQTQAARLLSFIKERGLIRSLELASLGVDRKVLARVRQRGLVEQVGRGMYRVAADAISRPSALALACKRMPHGVLCLSSALWLNGLLEQEPRQVWVAIDRKSRLPLSSALPIKVVRFSGEALSQGVTNLRAEQTPIRVFSPMKTVADCFKYRNKIGVNLGVEAIKAAIAKNRYNRQKLLHFAEICRVKKVVVGAADAIEHSIKTEAKQSEMETPRAWDSEVLRQQVWAEPLRVVARRYGVSDVALAKRCRKLCIPLPGRGYWAKKNRPD